MTDFVSNSVRPSRTLTAYAFLSQASQGQGDLLQGLAPLFRPIAKQYSGKSFDPKEFSAAVASRYGLKIHPWALEDFAPRLAEAGVLVQESTSVATHSYRYAAISEEFAQLSEGDVSVVIERFIAYARPQLEARGFSTSDNELEDALLSALTNLEFIDTLLRPTRTLAASGRTLVTTAESRPVALDAQQEAGARLEVLCAGFILHSHRHDPRTYELLTQFVSGALIVEVVTEFQTPSLATNLNELTVLLDSPFLMSLLDLGAPEATEFARDVVSKLRDHGAKLATFRHCVDELKDNLKAVMSATMTGSGHGATARRLPIANFATYVRAVQGDPETRLNVEGIKVFEVLATERWFRNFTQQDEGDVEASLGNYENPLARSRDAASVAATIRYRGGVRARMGRFDNSKFLFVTENPRLVRSVTRLLASKHLYRQGEVPPAITDRYLAGLLWALFGGKANELAPKLLLANCAAALEPSSDLLVKMRNFIKDLSPEETQYYTALMTTDRASQHLVEITLGESRLLTSDNAPAVLEQLKATLVEKEHQSAQKQQMELEQRYGRQVEGLQQARENAVQLAESRDAERLVSETRVMDLADVNTRLQAQIREMQELSESDTLIRLEVVLQNVKQRAMRIQLLSGIAVAVLVVATGLITGSAVAGIWKDLAWVVTGLLAFVGFWKVPDLFFARRIERNCRLLYEKQCEENNLNAKDPRFEVSLLEGKITRRPPALDNRLGSIEGAQ